MSQEDQLTQYEKSHKSLFDRINNSSISLKNSTTICRRCQRSYTKQQYTQHAKNCKRQKEKSSTNRQDVSKTESFNLPHQTQQLTNSNIFYDNLVTSVLAFIKTGVQQLLNNTKYLNRGVVLKVLGKKCINFAAQIPEIVDPNDFRNLINEDKYMSEILKTINDVFNPSLVELRMSKFTQNRKTRVRRKLNCYLKTLQMPPLYSVQKVIHQFERSKLPFMFRQLSGFVLKMFATKLKKYVHLGLDLLIIFHSMQRFPSAMDNVKVKVIEIMENFKENKIISTTIISTKINKKVDMFLNEQLISWLIEFEWKEFAFGYRFYQRITEYFNFGMYSLRRGVITEAEIFLSRPDPTILTNHVSNRNTDYYLVALHQLKNKQFHESLRVEEDDQIKKKYERYLNLDRIIPKILKPLHIPGQQYELKSSLCQSKQPLIFDSVAVQEIHEDKNSDSAIESSEDEGEMQDLIVQGFNFKLRDGIFSGNIFFDSETQQNCHACHNSHPTMVCLFCVKHYHADCLPEFCKCMKLNMESIGILAKGIDTNQPSLIKMPPQYFHNNSHFLASFRKLIHMRGFYFTTCATLLGRQTILSNNFEKAQQFHSLPEYQKYQGGQYFPPLILGVSGDQNPNGTGVGVFCAQNISSNVLIGEYGGDIVSENQMIFIKRRDMSMLLAEVAGQKYYVGCVKHCSYVQLVNCSQERANCSIILAIVNKKLKLLLYTARQIQKGQQLLYYYGENFTSTFKNSLRSSRLLGSIHNKQNKVTEPEPAILSQTLAQSNRNTSPSKIKPKITETNQQKKESSSQLLSIFSKLKKCEVEISTNSCYAQSLLILYRYFKQYFLDSLSELSQELKKRKMNPNKFVSMFNKYRNIPENSSKQEDIMEFYYFIEQQLMQDDSPFYEMAVFQSKQCLECNRITKRYVSEKQWYIVEDSNISLQSSCEVEVRCLFCQMNTVHKQIRRLESGPELLLLTFKRNQSNEIKLKYHVNLQDLKSHQGCEYEPQVVVIHRGQSASSGHYIVNFLKYNCIFDRNKFIDGCSDFSTDVYMAVYTKKLPPIPTKRKYNIPSLSAGIYLDLSSKVEQNTEKVYKIASIIKLITYLVCRNLCAKFNISLNQSFTIPRIEVFGMNVVLEQNEQVEIKTLYELSLVCSSADAAAALAIIFGKIIKSKSKDLEDYDPEKVFLNEMISFCRNQIKMIDTVIKDACGLKPNLSTVRDIRLLLQFIKDEQELIKILQLPFVIFHNEQLKNTNEIYKLCLGKTGTHSMGVCFAGLYNKKPVICLDFNSKSSMFNFLEDRFTLQMQKTRKKKIDN